MTEFKSCYEGISPFMREFKHCYMREFTSLLRGNLSPVMRKFKPCYEEIYDS